MLRITIELIPHGVEEAKRTLTTAEIWNTSGATDENSGNYSFKLMDCGRLHSRTFRQGSVEGFPRKKMTAWSLLKRVLNNADLR